MNSSDTTLKIKDDTTEGEDYSKLLAHAKSYLPFLKKLMGTKSLGIQEEHLNKLQSLYDMVDSRRLSTSKLKSCQSVFCSLYSKYHSVLTKDQKRIINNPKNLIQFNEDESRTKSSKMGLITNKSDQKINSKSEHSSKMSISTAIMDNQLDSNLAIDDKQNNDSIIEKKTSFLSKREKSSSNKDDDILSNLTKDDLKPGFSDNYLQPNKVIGVTVYASTEKLNESDTTVVSHSEITKQISDDVTKLSKNNTTIDKNMSKGVYNMNDIDGNNVKDLIENLNTTDKIELSSFPSVNSTDSEVVDVKCNSSIESKTDHVTQGNAMSTSPNSQSTCSMVPSKPTSIREKLNNEINVLHKIGSSNEPKQKCITALKPGTLFDLENSKGTRTSLHIESLKPISKSKEINADTKLPSAEIIVSRDPRIRNKSLLNHENNLIQSSSQTHTQQMIPVPITNQIQNPNSINIPSLLALSVPPAKFTFIEPKPQDHLVPVITASQQEVSNNTLSGYNRPTNCQNLPSRMNTQPLNESFPTEHSGNSNQSQFHNCRSFGQYRYNHNFNRNNLNQVYHNKTVRYRESIASSSTYKRYNNITVNRDPRSMNIDKKLSEPQYRSFKEYREAKYGKKINFNSELLKSNKEKNHRKDNDRFHTLNLESEKLKNKIKIDTKYIKPLNNLGMINDSSNIKNFKIPKIKRKEETETINGDVEKNLIKDDTEKDIKFTTIKDSYTYKDTKCKIIKDKTEVDNNIETIENNKEDLKNKRNIQIELEKSNDSININKNEIEVDIKQCDLNESTKQLNKPKKPKKYSKEKEFEKIVKEAVESLLVNDNACGPRIRTRSSLRKKEDALNTINLKKMNDSSENENKITFGECSKNLDNKYENTENVDESIETGQNIISSTSKEPSEIDSSTEVASKNEKESIVSSNEINSTVDMTNNQENIETALKKLISNPELVTKMLSVLSDENKIQKSLEITDNTIIGDIPDNKNILNKDCNVIEKQKKNKKKIKKEKKKKRKMKKNMSEESLSGESKNEFSKHVSDNDDINNCNIVKVKKVKSGFDDLNDDCKINSNFDNNHDNSPTVEVNIKLSKRKKSKEYYGNFEILKDSCETKLNDLKMVFAKNVKGIENSNLDVLPSTIQTTNETIQNLKPKKPFLGPLSVKLARQKINEHNVDLDEIMESEITTEKKINDSKTIVNVVHDSYVVIQPIESISLQSTIPKKASKEIHSVSNVDTIEQNTSNVNVIETNIQNKSDIKKPRPKMTELDKLHADINEMYDSDKLLSVPNVRQCRMNKSIDYVNNNQAVVSRKNKTSSVQQLDLHGDQNNKSTFKLNKKKQVVKKNNIKTVKTTVLNKKVDVLPPSKSVKSKSKKLKTNKNKKLTKKKVVTNDDSQLNVSPLNSKVLTVNDFKDKSYFQTKDHILECKFCNYKDIGFNIVLHYKKQHNKEEVLASRLSTKCAEILIKKSLQENYGSLNYEQCEVDKSFSCTSENICFTCIFCQFSCSNFITFYDHISTHTGEYRYKCKMCEEIYPYEYELENHILKHSDYDNTNGISDLLKSIPIQKTKLFGYLCSFCNYIQIDYNNIVNHMNLRHFDEDKKCNGHWTVIRVNMSHENENYKSSVINYDNLSGCLPPIQYGQDIQQNVSQGEKQHINNVIELQEELLTDIVVNIKNENCVQEIVKDPLKLNMLQLSPKQSDLLFESKMSADDHINFEYTLKEKSSKCIVGGLSCELINSVLLFKCSASRCLDNQFSTVILNDLFKHIELNHQFWVWDQKCDVCKHKDEMIQEQFFLKNALEHIIAHHLVLKKDKQSSMSKNIDLQEERKEQEIVENTNTKVTAKAMLPIRFRLLPGDMLSNPKSDTSVITNDCLPVYEAPNETNLNNQDDELKKEQIINNIKQPSFIKLKNPFDITTDPTNINCEISDMPVIGNVRTLLKKKKLKEVRAYITNRNKLSDNNSSIWMKIETHYKVISPTASIFLESGQCTINNGISIQGTYCLIDTGYKINYLKHIRDLPMNMMKTRLALTEMICLPKLLGLYKCMDRTCTKIFSQKELFKLHMQLHFSNVEKKKKNQTYNSEQFKKCIYCFKVFENVDALANHIEDQYTYCDYFCPYCFYRAYTPSHVLVHQHKIHNKYKPRIIKLEYNASDNEEMPREVLKAVDFNEYILPIICNVGHCTFSCFLHNDYLSHLNKEHQQCDKFCCYICANQDNGEGFFALQPKLMTNHFKLHNINKYQCIFCLFGTEVIDSMLVHLAMEHFEYDSVCLERSPRTKTCDAKKIENLKIIKISKVIDNGIIEVVNLPSATSSIPEIQPQKYNKRRLDCPDVLSAAIEFANIDTTTQSSDTIIITVPDQTQMTNHNTSLTPAINNEFIMLDDAKNQNNESEPFKINNIWTEMKNNIIEPQKSKDDVIIIDDEDEVLNNDASNNEENIKMFTKRRRLSNSTEKSTNGLNKAKRLALPLVLLDNLFTCKGCGLVLSSGDEYQTHLMNCSSFVNGFQCPYCTKIFKTALNITEHVKLHGPDRFSCSFCNIKISSQRAITHHMKIEHKIIHLDFVPIHNNLTDIERDEFIVYEDKTIQTKSNMNICYTCEKCLFKGNNKKAIDSHMKNIHTVDHYDIHTVYPPSNNYTEEYLIKIRSIEVVKPRQKQTGIKRKCVSNNVGNKNKKNKKNKDNIIQEKPKLFSPETIEIIPKSHIFSEPIGCSLCTYNTKVRSNLILHLNGHKVGQDNTTTKEIVNPVPIKSELMFDKMINLSASSFEAMNSEKMKIIELNKKIVEVAFQGNLNLELYPPFIPKNKRYKCSIPSCTYTGVTEDMLKRHISILHPDYQCYICPHCLPSCTLDKVVELNKIEFHLMHHSENLYSCQYCDYIDFNRDEMKTHMRHTHFELLTNKNQSNIIVIRQTMLKDDIIDRNRLRARSIAAEWICNICCSGIRYTENEITSHIIIAHNISNMFKCPMCQFEHKDDDIKVFEEHYKLEHPSVAVKSLRVFEKITDVEMEEQQKQTKRLLNTRNIQEQQALQSIELSCISQTCRGIPVEESSKTKTCNKSRGVSKSPKSATKNSALLNSRKQKMLIDTFSVDDSLGTITSTGLFACPRCNVFETMNIDHFRDHLFKDVNFKTWRCIKCLELSDSPKKMAWHVKRHGNGSKYEKIESAEKLHWVEQVIVHQNSLIKEFKTKNKGINIVGHNETVVSDKQSCFSPLKQNEDNIESEKNVLDSKITHQPNDVIYLLDDSDDE